MAMAGHLLSLKQPGLKSGCVVSPAARLSRPLQCFSHASTCSSAIARKVNDSCRVGKTARFEKCRPLFSPLHGFRRLRSQGSSLGFLGCPRAAAGNGDAEVADNVNVQEESSLPSFFKELTVDRGESPNYLLLASGFILIVLMRDAILQEVARWGIWFSRFALYAAEGITIALAALTNVAAEPIAFLLNLVGWAMMAVSDLYSIIVETTPVRALLNSLLLSLAVISIGDATASSARGSPSHLVGIATAIGLAGVLEFVSPGVVILTLASITAYAYFVQKADPVSVFMPATVTIVAISEPVLQAVVFALFLVLSIYANWKAAPQQHETKLRAGRPSMVVVAVTSAICVSLVARLLYARCLVWLLLR